MKKALAFLFGLMVPVLAGATQYHICHYGEACRVPFTLYDYTDPTDPELTTAVSIVTGDVYWTCILSGTSTQDASTILTGDITEIGGISFELELGATETDCERIKIDIVDAAGDVWFPHTISIDTVGNASAGVEGILTSVPNNLATTDNIGINWGDVTNPTTSVTLSGTTVGTATALGAGAVNNTSTTLTETLTANPAAGGIVAASFGAGAIDAAAIATNALGDLEVVDTALGEATSNWATATGFSTHAAADVWAVDATTQQTQGTFGGTIGDQAADADDIWALANTNLDAAVSSRNATTPLDAAGIRTATGLSAANLDTQIAGINTNVDATQTTIGAAGAGLTEAGGTGDHLTAIDLPNQTMDITGTITTVTTATTASTCTALGAGAVNNTSTTLTETLNCDVVAGGIAAGDVATGGIEAGDFAANAITDAAVANDVQVDVLTVETVDATDQLASATSGLTAIATGTAQSGAADSITLASAETFIADELIGAIVQITGGTGDGQSRCIDDYGVATDRADVSSNWITNPDNTSTYEIKSGFGLCPDTTATVATTLLDADCSGSTTNSTLGAICNDLEDAGRLDAILDARASQATADLIVADTSELQVDDVPGLIAALDIVVDRVETDTQDLQTQVGTAGAGLSDLGGMSTAMKAEVNVEADTALTDYDAPTDTEMVAAFTEVKGATWAGTDTLEAIRDRGDVAWTTGSGTGLTGVTGTTQTATHSSTSIILASGAVANDDDFLGWVFQVTSGNCAKQKAIIIDSVRTTDAVTLRTGLRTDGSGTCTAIDSDLDAVTYELAPYGG